jgi:DNA-directed RNA polymerase specialized sigma24 family protein
MDPGGSVTHCLNRCNAGNPGAGGPLGEGDFARLAALVWERYFARLAALAGQKLRRRPGGACDGEDVAVSVFANFFRALARGRYPELRGRDALWRLLQKILEHKVLDRIKHAHRAKRDIRTVEDGLRVEDLAGREPTPEEAALLAEECQALITRLGDDRLRQIARLRVEGYTDNEVAARLGCSLRAVERKLEWIRHIWSKEVR